MTTSYLFHFAQVHEEFRIPELLSVSEISNFDIEFPDDLDITRPFMVLGLASEEHAHTLARRCVLIKSVCEFYARGTTYDQLHSFNRADPSKWTRYIEDTSFKLRVLAYNHTIPQRRQRDVIETFAYMGLLGKIDVVNPEETFVCYEEYVDKHGTTRHKHEGDGNFREVFFGRLIEEGTARSLIKTFDVKKRLYYGNTSMEAEISLLMANQTLASPGKLIYDPFIGTGSMAYTTAHFGAWVFGSDIDGRQMRGKDTTPGILRAAAQYGVADQIIDLCTFDVTQNPWRCGDMFDAIITDPPYGVRAGAKRLGRKPRPVGASPRPASIVPPEPRPSDLPYVPPTKPYELSALATDLILLSRYLLRPNGRLVFFLPTVTDEYEEVDVKTMLCDGMEVVANSLQDFGSWGRRLITIRKITTVKHPPPTFEPQGRRQALEPSSSSPSPSEGSDGSRRPEGGGEGVTEHVPAHKDFRMKYFKKFKKEEYVNVDT